VPLVSRIVTPYEGSGRSTWDPSAPIDAPLRLHATTVLAEWVDYNAHMTESCFLLVFGDNADAFFRFVGIDEAYRAAGHSLYTVQTSLHHRREAAEGDPLDLTLRVLDHDDARVHVYHEMLHGDTGDLLAAAEQLLVHVNIAAARSTPMPTELLGHVRAVREAHSRLDVPELVGRPLRIRHRP
jgi:acyl-CoA thioester hydrolase